MGKTLINKLTKLGKNIVAGATSLGLLATPLAGQVTGSVRHLQAEEQSNSYPEIYAFYQLPGQVKGFTFMDFHNGEKGYFGKTALSREIARGIGARTELVHANQPFFQAGVGVEASVPHLPKNTLLNLDYLPVYISKEGKIIPDKSTVGYFGSVKLPHGINANSFGKVNIRGEKGPEWAYGEMEVSKRVGPLSFGYNGALIGTGTIKPKVQNRVFIRAHF